MSDLKSRKQNRNIGAAKNSSLSETMKNFVKIAYFMAIVIILIGNLICTTFSHNYGDEL